MLFVDKVLLHATLDCLNQYRYFRQKKNFYILYRPTFGLCCLLTKMASLTRHHSYLNLYRYFWQKWIWFVSPNHTAIGCAVYVDEDGYSPRHHHHLIQRSFWWRWIWFIDKTTLPRVLSPNIETKFGFDIFRCWLGWRGLSHHHHLIRMSFWWRWI